MRVPRMVIVAGPSGGGKSSLFPVKLLKNVDPWNNDDYRARLNGERLGRPEPIYTNIPKDITLQAGAAMERFIEEHIAQRKSFAFETTLRPVTFDQARRATENGFRVEMLFVAAGDVELHIDRVKSRGNGGGHSASEASLREIYARAMGHLVTAFQANQRGTIETLGVFHNLPADRSTDLEPPEPLCVAEMVRGNPVVLANYAPDWFHSAVRGTQFEFRKLEDRYRDDHER